MSLRGRVLLVEQSVMAGSMRKQTKKCSVNLLRRLAKEGRHNFGKIDGKRVSLEKLYVHNRRKTANAYRDLDDYGLMGVPDQG